MYTLYQSYNVPISPLFITGFASSAVFGSIAGSMADRHGRKRACVIYCILEIVINLLEHSPNFWVLMIGRVLGGISTSILFSAFESWIVTQHHRHGLDEVALRHTLSLASTWNGACAVVAGERNRDSFALNQSIPTVLIILLLLSFLFTRGWIYFIIFIF
jgi:MFS family permease